jgi:NADPH2:quinone reductase
MRAVLCKELGNPDALRLEELPSPPLTDGAVRVAIHAAGVNFADTLVIAGQYQEKPPLPFAPGLEIAGIVSETRSGAQRLKPGDRVLGTVPFGGYADEAVVPEQNLYRIPDAMEFITAAGFPVAYGTSHGALDWRARLQRGETLVVLGAAGGVGLTAVEIGKAMGATVIAVAGGAEKLAVAKRHGADHLVDYTSEDIKLRLRALTDGRGADVVYDAVGGDAFDASLRAIAWEGRILLIGFASGRVPQIPANLMLVKNCDAIGFHWGTYRERRPELMRRSFETLFRWFEKGKLKPHVSHTLPLEEAPRALDLLRRRKSTGKVVLTTGRT